MLNFLVKRSAASGRYTPVMRLMGHTGPIHALAISPDGKWLASGGKCISQSMLTCADVSHEGSDALRAWNKQSGEQVPISSPSHEVDLVSCVAWLMFKEDPYILYGTGLGYMGIVARSSVQVSKLCCRRIPLMTSSQNAFEQVLFKRVAHGEQMTTIAVGPVNQREARFATGTRDMYIHVWSWNAHQLTCVFSTSLPNTVPIGLAFLDNRDHDVQVFGLFDGRT